MKKIFSQVFFALVFLSAVAAQLEKKKNTGAINAKVTKPLLLARKVPTSSDQLERREKSLLNSFPFNAQEHEEHGHHGEHGDHGDHAHGDHGDHGDHAHEDHDEHGEHGDHHERTALIQDTPLLARQGYGEESEQNSPDFASVAESGKKCVQKVMMVEETVWEDHETCDHSYDKRCHKSYTTTYPSQQEEE